MNKARFQIGGLFLVLALLASTNSHEQQRRDIGRKLGRHKKTVVIKDTINIYDLDTLVRVIPRNRQLFHRYIDQEQRRADASDGAVDGIIYYPEDTTLTAMLTKTILTDIDQIQIMIENAPANGRDAFDNHQTKLLYLQAVRYLLQRYNANTHIDPYYYRKLVSNMRSMIIAVNEHKLMDFVHANPNIYSLENGKYLFQDHPEERAYVYIAVGRQDPKFMINRLADYANDSFADEIISNAARVAPSVVFNFASSTDMILRNAVRRNPDPLVQAIVKVADKSVSPLKALPFLSDIYTGKKTIEQVDAIAADPDLYYQNLVRLKLENDTLGRQTYTEELAYRGLRYVRDMNDLHESPDAIRFKSIDKLSPEALYFIIVFGQDEIYTSSFLGTFKRMMERLKPASGDSLLSSVHYEHFRTFLRMCAGYNTLTDFLATMTENEKTTLMTSFIAGLEKGPEDDLEDAVDVADAFGSIRDTTLATFLQNQVKKNYEYSYRIRSKKGMIIYSLLARLFDGVRQDHNDSEAEAQSQKLGLPPINLVLYKNLVNDSGIIYEQYFFFGDEDGKNSYNSFLGNFRDGKWKIVTEKYWSVISSIKGKPIVIYANLPIPEPDDQDAQNRLCAYLNDRGIYPTIMVHRGHSYHLPLTLDKLARQVRIVMLGSCGGYHNLSIVLDHAPDAHIISSKQTGMMNINEPIIRAINDRLLLGKDINWIPMWRELDAYFSNKPELRESFSDYVPPYKNLGAIFIKAYRRMMNTDNI